MYHYNPSTALEELTEDATLPNPVHVRDMMLRRKLNADQSLQLNRIFLEYQKFFGEAQKLGKEILTRLAAWPFTTRAGTAALGCPGRAKPASVLADTNPRRRIKLCRGS